MKPDLGKLALEAGVAAVHAAYRFERPADAKKAWEKIRDRCTGISANRVVADTWVPGRPLPDPKTAPQIVIVAGEESDTYRREVEKARRLMRSCRGVEVTPEPELLELTAANRARNIAERGGKTDIQRTPQGKLVMHDGTTVGYVTGGQG